MMKKIFAVVFAALVSFAVVGSNTSAQMMNEGMKGNNPMVGGAAMYRSKTIVENALNSPIHTTLVAAVRAAGLVDTLSGKGPFTVFAPTNDAFAKLPAGTVDTLVMPENKAALTRILTYHVVAGRYDSKKIAQLIKKGHGTATFTTVSGDKLMARMSGNSVILVDEKGGTSTVTTADVYQSNGVIHVVDAVVMPN
ncbi:MAG TPA: fasciclin domain-containing protein [Pyrinomonadaceae bacterium]